MLRLPFERLVLLLFNLPSSSDAAIFRSTLARALGIACVDDAIVWYDGFDIMIYYDIYIYILYMVQFCLCLIK